MGYVGNQTTNSFSSQPSKQDFTGSSGSSITLSHAVASPEHISLYINHVRQEPTTSYTVADTTVSFVGYTIAATDDVYVTYNALALQNVVPPDGSVTGAKLASGAAATNLGSSVNLATIKDSGGSNTAMTIDSTGRILTPARPAFFATRNGATVTDGNIYVFETAQYNIGSHYSTSTGKFTAPVAGLYSFSANILGNSNTSANGFGIYKTDSTTANQLAVARTHDSSDANHNTLSLTVVANLSANQEVFCYVREGSMYGGAPTKWSTFFGYLIG